MKEKLNNYSQLEILGITNKKVLQTIRNLPRKLFVPKDYQEFAYQDTPLPIACGQTISQPFIVAYMTEKLELKPTDKVMEIGTGSGFQTAVLAQLVKEVYTIEIYHQLTEEAQKLLTKLGYKNIQYKVGDGKLGWPEFAPFEAIIITAVSQELPSLLLKQLKIGGKMILPLELENGEQYLFLITKPLAEKIIKKKLIPVRFVPLK
jgi:protein-L-isoaspartate(D-aspartate) O-methyltransferase